MRGYLHSSSRSICPRHRRRRANPQYWKSDAWNTRAAIFLFYFLIVRPADRNIALLYDVAITDYLFSIRLYFTSNPISTFTCSQKLSFRARLADYSSSSHHKVGSLQKQQQLPKTTSNYEDLSTHLFWHRHQCRRHYSTHPQCPGRMGQLVE